MLCLLAVSFSLTSCKKDGDDDGPAGMGGSMKLKHDGSSWSASLSVQAINSNGVLNITGSDYNANQCQLILMNVPGPGTYQIGGNPSNPNSGRWTQGLGTNDTYSTMLGQGSGTCTITELTGSKVAGTFEFTAKNMAQVQVTITEGSFSADLTK